MVSANILIISALSWIGAILRVNKGDIVLIGKKYKLESDSLNVILSKKVTRTRKADKTKYEDWEHVGYYSTVSAALHGMVDFEIRETSLKEFKIVVQKQEELHNLISSLTNLSEGRLRQ